MLDALDLGGSRDAALVRFARSVTGTEAEVLRAALSATGEPSAPASPATPTGPVTPSGPVTPTARTTPTGPVTPAAKAPEH